MKVNKHSTKSIPARIHINEYKVVFGQLDAYDPEITAKLETITPEMMTVNPKQTIKKLEVLHAQYPQVPTILNNLAYCYSVSGNNDKAFLLVKKMVENFPDYLFGRISLAMIALNDNEHDKIPKIFNHCFDIKDLYPERDEFHVTEVKSFSRVMAKYFCRINDARSARIYYDIIEKLADDKMESLDLLYEISKVEKSGRR